MNKQQIKALALANGFKLKEQPDGSIDLNPYVYDFALALMAETGRAGFVAGTECCADYLDTYYADIDFSKHADCYAEKVRNGE